MLTVTNVLAHQAGSERMNRQEGAHLCRRIETAGTNKNWVHLLAPSVNVVTGRRYKRAVKMQTRTRIAYQHCSRQTRGFGKKGEKTCFGMSRREENEG